MDFRSAIRSLVSDGMAAKRPSWKGYIYRTTPSGAADGAYEIRFKYASGTEVPVLNDIVVRDGNVYKGATGSTKAVALTDYCPLTTFLFDAIVNAVDFDVGTVADFESAAAGTGEF